MKVVMLLVAKVLAIVTANVAFVWAVVEFILYLAKDKVFNWTSVWLFVISIIVSLVLIVFAGLWQVKARNKAMAEMEAIRKQRRDKMPKSRFQQRLDEMREKQANT